MILRIEKERESIIKEDEDLPSVLNELYLKKEKSDYSKKTKAHEECLTVLSKFLSDKVKE